MNRLYKILITCVLFFISCNLAEDLVTDKKAPEVDAIQSDKGFNVDPGDTVTFSVNATNPEEGTLSYEWRKEAGEFLNSNRESSVVWKKSEKISSKSILSIEGKEDQ